jgi:FAD/FMN-containing dehydrogenase
LSLGDSLARISRGEVLADEWSRRVYSVDASHYEVMPEAVVCPSDQQDVEQICRYCHAKKIPITARGAGTGLLGQSLSAGVIIDFRKHMDKILEIEDDHVGVQPGVVKAVLDLELRKRGKFLPPDPASSNYCTIGGMIADNSSGIHCLGYGNTIDFLEEVKVVYGDGSAGFADKNYYDPRMARLRDLVSPHTEAIRSGYPRVSKNSCGYRLDAVVREEEYLPHKVFAASEGTLGLVTEARFRILNMPDRRCMIVLGFSDVLASIEAVPSIMKLSPAALEMMDHSVAAQGSNSKDEGCLLLVEFAGEGREPELGMETCRHLLSTKCTIVEYASDEQSLVKIWNARKSALNNIMKLTVGSRKPVGLVEDTVVPQEVLLDHVTEILSAYRENHLEYVMYGHAGNGNIHTRPMIDLSSQSEIELMQRIATNIFSKVVKWGGTITGEHGDGIARTPYIEMMYGRDITQLFASVKKSLDPGLVLNPGKKIPSSTLQ